MKTIPIKEIDEDLFRHDARMTKWLLVDFGKNCGRYPLKTVYFIKGFAPKRLNKGNDYYLIGRHD